MDNDVRIAAREDESIPSDEDIMAAYVATLDTMEGR